MGHRFIHNGKGLTRKERRRQATMKAKGHVVGRPKNQPDTIKYLVFSMFRAVEKAKRSLDDVNFAVVAKAVHEKFPNSKFDLKHFTWYLCHYRQTKLESNFNAVENRQKVASA